MFDAIQDFTVSPDGKNYAYIANAGGQFKNNRFGGGKWFVVLNGKKNSEYDLVQKISFDPDNQLVFWGNKGGVDNSYEFFGGEWFLNYKEKESYPFDEEQVLNPVFSFQKTIAYGGKKNKKFYWLVNHIQNEGFDKVGSFLFNPQKEDFAYIGTEQNKSWVVFNGKRQGEFEKIKELAFSHDGQWLAYAGFKENKWFFVLNHQKRFALPFMGKILFMEGSNFFALEGKDSSGAFIVINGKKGRSYDKIELLGFSKQGKYFFYKAQRGKEFFWVANQKELFKGPDVGLFLVSPYDNTFVFTGKIQSSWGLFVNGIQKIQGEGFEKIFFSPFNEIATIEKQEYQKRVWIDKQVGPTFDEIKYVVPNPNKKQWIYVAQEKEKWYFVNNHVVLEKDKGGYQEILGLEYSQEEKSFIGLVLKNKIITLVKFLRLEF